MSKRDQIFNQSMTRAESTQALSEQHKTVSERVWGVPGLTTMRGFLPLKATYILQDADFDTLNQLLNDMPVIKKDGAAGLLAQKQFRQACTQLPDHSAIFVKWFEQISTSDLLEEQKDALAMDLAVAFRDYQYLKMGYLFESVHHGEMQAADILPRNIANPLVYLANIFQHKPWLEYASGYVLLNSGFTDEIAADKIELIRQWHGGPDEYYFQTVHSIIEWETPALFQAIDQVIRGIESDDNQLITKGMEQGIVISQAMLERLKQMTKLSRPAYYAADVRPQIQGLVGNCGEGKLFPEKGVYFDSEYFADGAPHWLNDIRGQTGAQSSIIPLLDNILGVTDFYAKGDNPLTKMLREFRHYRPKPHTKLLDLVEAAQQRLHIRQTLKIRAPLLLAQWTGVICQFREFHFFLAMAYIVKPGKTQPKAQSRAIGTGGSPTPKYLPQHVSESIIALREALAAIDPARLTAEEQATFNFWNDYAAITDRANAERSQAVADYLADVKNEAQLDATIQMTYHKIAKDEITNGR